LQRDLLVKHVKHFLVFMMEEVGPDILANIFDELTDKELCKCALVSQKWKILSEMDRMWQKRIESLQNQIKSNPE
jgi:hypothetical protein